jgi:eukaryotic-like serine/threonine-protein kinase
LIMESEVPKAPMSWTPDQKMLVYFQTGDIWAVPVDGEPKPIPILRSAATEALPQVSPDGKWLAYQSNETARVEVYVKAFPEGPGKWQVSTDGGVWPRWRGDGRELYFVSAPSMWAAEIHVTGSSLQAGVPQSLFTLGADPSLAAGHVASYHRYAVSADGQRFLLSQPSGGVTTSGGLADQIASIADGGGTGIVGISPNGVTIVVNWAQLLTRK